MAHGKVKRPPPKKKPGFCSCLLVLCIKECREMQYLKMEEQLLGMWPPEALAWQVHSSRDLIPSTVKIINT